MKWYIVIPFMVVLLLQNNIVSAAEADLNADISEEDKAKFDQILTPVLKIYNFVKYTVSIIAALALLFVAASYMLSGDDIRKRDSAKHWGGYIMTGLVIIWAAPYVVNLLI